MVSPVRRVRKPTGANPVRVEESILTVTSSGVGVEEEERKVLEVRKFETEPAYVRVNAGVTKALAKKFEFLRIDVSLTVPCYVEEMEAVQKKVAGLVEDMLIDEVEQYDSDGVGE